MAGTLTVQNLQGPSSGANANKVIIPSGQTLYAAGHVVQVVTNTNTSGVTVSTTSLSDTGISLSITPSLATSKILIRFDVHYLLDTNASGVSFAIYRSIGGGADTLVESYPQDYTLYWRPAGSGAQQIRTISPITNLDSPSTTSSVAYKLYARYHTANAYINSGGSSYIQLMEIAG